MFNAVLEREYSNLAFGDAHLFTTEVNGSASHSCLHPIRRLDSILGKEVLCSQHFILLWFIFRSH